MKIKILRDVGRGQDPVIHIPDKNKKTDLRTSGVFVVPSLRKVEKKYNGSVFFMRVRTSECHTPDRNWETIRIAAAGILILFIINIINIYHHGVKVGGALMASASSGYEHLQKAGNAAKNSDFTSAENSFAAARKDFASALNSISLLGNSSDTFFAKEKTYSSVQNLLEVAVDISIAGQQFTEAADDLSLLPALFIQSNSVNLPANNSLQRPSITDKLKKDLLIFQQAGEKIRQANQKISMVSIDVMPANLKPELLEAKSKVKKLVELLDRIENMIPAILELLGDRYPHTYLVLLQNDTEVRPTGGFIGSYMLIDVNDGYITKMDFHDVYDADGQLQEEIPAPEEIASVSKKWRLRDSNYSPDFSISAEKAAWFLQKEKGPSVDTVIAINQSFIARLFDITGPVHVEGLSKPLTKENYQQILSYIIESKLTGKNSPKIILEHFIDSFKAKLIEKKDFQKTLIAIISGIRDKKIMAYSRYPEIQQALDQFGITGRIIKTNPGDDYLNIVSISIGGNKSDLYMTMSANHNSFIDSSGKIRNELSMVRTHNWNEKVQQSMLSSLKDFGFNELSNSLAEILGSGTNRTYIRVYVPKGSVLSETVGIPVEAVSTKYDADLDKTYFLMEVDTSPGATREWAIYYDLPQSLSLLPVDTYRINIQQQPGISPLFLTKQIFFKPGIMSFREYPALLQKEQSGNLVYRGKLNTDLYLSAVVGSN